MNKQEIIDELEYNQHPLASNQEEIEWNNALDLAVNSEITELKTELKQAKAQIKVLEENQTIIYYADSYGGNP